NCLRLASVRLPPNSSSNSRFSGASLPKRQRKLGGRSRLLNSPRAEQGQKGLFLTVELEIPSPDDAQMPGTEIFDRCPVEILVDHRWAHVGATGNGRRVSQLRPHPPHHR